MSPSHVRAFWKGDLGYPELRWSREVEGARPVLLQGIRLLRKQYAGDKAGAQSALLRVPQARGGLLWASLYKGCDQSHSLVGPGSSECAGTPYSPQGVLTSWLGSV